MDLESRLTEYVTEARLRAIYDLAKEEDVDEKALIKYCCPIKLDTSLVHV